MLLRKRPLYLYPLYEYYLLRIKVGLYLLKREFRTQQPGLPKKPDENIFRALFIFAKIKSH